MRAHGRSAALPWRRVECARGLGELPATGRALHAGRSAAALPANFGGFRSAVVNAARVRQQRCSHDAVSLRYDGGDDLASFQFAAADGSLGRVNLALDIRGLVETGLAPSALVAAGDAASRVSTGNSSRLAVRAKSRVGDKIQTKKK